MKLVRLVLAVGAGVMSACETTTPIPDGAVILAQISYIAKPDEAANGFHFVPQPDEALNGVVPHPRDVPPAKHLLTDCNGEHNAEAKFALARFYYYRVGRSGRLDDYSVWMMVDAGLPVERGNLVEIKERVGRSNSRCLITSKIRAASVTAAGCDYRQDGQGALFSALDMASGQASMSLYCPFFEVEGWKSAPSGIIGGLVWWKPPPANAL